MDEDFFLRDKTRVRKIKCVNYAGSPAIIHNISILHKSVKAMSKRGDLSKRLRSVTLVEICEYHEQIVARVGL